MTPENMEKILIVYYAPKNQWLLQKIVNEGCLQN
jgi:hypothetical protein